jgi:hypothetical protein
MEPASAGAQFRHRVAGRCPRQAPGSRRPAGGVARMARPSLTAVPSPVRATVPLDPTSPIRSRRCGAPLCHSGGIPYHSIQQGAVPASVSGRCRRGRPQWVSRSGFGQRRGPCPGGPRRRGGPRKAAAAQNGTGRRAGRSSPPFPARSPVHVLPCLGLPALDMSQTLASVLPVPPYACCHVS